MKRAPAVLIDLLAYGYIFAAIVLSAFLNV